MQTIDYTTSLSIIYGIVYPIIIAAVVVYGFSFCCFVIYDLSFPKSLKESRRISFSRFFNTLFTLTILAIVSNFVINTISSSLVVNLREVIAFFESTSGIVTKSAEVGNYTYVLRQVLKSVFLPAINNCALCVLFFKYGDENNKQREVSEKIYRWVDISSLHFIELAIVFFFVLALFCVGLYSKYYFLLERVERPLICAHRGDNVHAPENSLEAFQSAAIQDIP